jgi:hypothetical protein
MENDFSRATESISIDTPISQLRNFLTDEIPEIAFLAATNSNFSSHDLEALALT